MAGIGIIGGGRAAGRRIDLDWLRIGAFGLLILYHIGMLYVPWDFHVKSAHRLVALEPVMLATNPWRLSLLFLVSGAVTRLMAERMTASGLAAGRLRRLLPPLLFGIFVVVPPQSYLEAVERAGYAGSFAAFYHDHYLAFGLEFCGTGRCLILPTWNHLWFVAYVLAYSLLLAVPLAAAPGLLRRLEAAGTAACGGIGVLLWPALLLAAARLLLFPRFGETHALLDDGWAHAAYGEVYLFGFVLARSAPVWAALVRWRHLALALALAAYAAILVLQALREPGVPPGPDWLVLRHLAQGIDQWCAVAALLGYAHRYVRGDGPLRRYLTEAVFPWYILHQTAIILAAHALKPLGLPAVAEAGLVLLATLAACGLGFEAGRRIPPLRPLLGLAPRRGTAPGRPAVAAQASTCSTATTSGT